MDWVVVIILVGAALWLGFLLGRRKRGPWAHSVLAPGSKTDQQADQQRLRLVLDLISTITSTLIYNRVLELVLDLGAQVLEGSTEANDPKLVSAVYLFSPEGTKTVLRLAVSRHMVQADMRSTLAAAAGVIAQVIDGGEPVLVNQIKDDPELSQIFSLRACNSLYCLPLRVGLDAYGIIFFAHNNVDYFSPAQQDVLGILTHQGVIALQNARLYNDLEQEKERMMDTQEEARKKLARDLHDGPTQSVSAIAMRINFTRKIMNKDTKAAARELEKIEDLARRTTKEIRHMLFTLRPLVLETQGLVAAFRTMAEKMRDTFNQAVSVEVDEGILPDLEISRQTVLFYIAEEAVNNARKYAQAANIWVQIKRLGKDMAILEIKDDGKGFDVEQVGTNYEDRGSLGMVNMRERAELINGLMRINSSPGKGTAVQVVIPLTEEAAERLRLRAQATT